MRCRFCDIEIPGEPRYCFACGSRLSGGDFDTLTACLVPSAYIARLRVLVDRMMDEAEESLWRRAQDGLVACEELNRDVLHCANRLAVGNPRDLTDLLPRDRAEEMLGSLPADVPGLSDIRVAVFTLVADLERRQAVRPCELLVEKARRVAMFAEGREVKRAVKAWQDVLFWLSQHRHPGREHVEAEAQTALAGLAAKA